MGSITNRVGAVAGCMRGALVIGVFLAGGQVWASFGPATTISSSAGTPPRVASYADGRFIIVWGKSDQSVIRARIQSVDGVWGGNPVMSGPSGTHRDPEVATSAAGTALVVWNRGDVHALDMRPIAANEGLLTRQQIFPVGFVWHHRVVMDDAGAAVIVWQITNGGRISVQRAIRAADGTLSPIETLSNTTHDALEPDVAITPDGEALVVWRRWNGTHWRVQARRVSVAGAIGPVHQISSAQQDAFEPHVGVDAEGDGYVIWRTSETPTRIKGRAIAADGTLGATVDILSPGVGDSTAHDLAMNDAGMAAMVWTHVEGAHTRVQMRVRSAAGVMGPRETLTPANRTSRAPTVDVSADGTTHIAWHQVHSGVALIRARTRLADATLTAIEDLGQGTFGQIALAGDGSALVGWTTGDAIFAAFSPSP